MTDTYIADLPAGAPAVGTDLIEIQRGPDGPGTGKNLLLSDLMAWIAAQTVFAANFGDGVSATFTITHDLDTLDVQVEVYRNAAPYDTVIVDTNRADANNVVLSGFATAPPTDGYRVLIRAL